MQLQLIRQNKISLQLVWRLRMGKVENVVRTMKHGEKDRIKIVLPIAIIPLKYVSIWSLSLYRKNVIFATETLAVNTGNFYHEIDNNWNLKSEPVSGSVDRSGSLDKPTSSDNLGCRDALGSSDINGRVESSKLISRNPASKFRPNPRSLENLKQRHHPVSYIQPAPKSQKAIEQKPIEQKPKPDDHCDYGVMNLPIRICPN